MHPSLARSLTMESISPEDLPRQGRLSSTVQFLPTEKEKDVETMTQSVKITTNYSYKIGVTLPYLNFKAILP